MSGYSDADQGEIEGDITAMYRAGTKELPDKAGELARAARTMSSAIGEVQAQLSSFGSPRVGPDVVSLLTECHEGVRSAVGTLNDIGAAVVAIADDFVERDTYARSVFDGLGDDLKAGPDPQPVPPRVSEPGYVPAPETPSGPYLPGEVGPQDGE